jgi:hypothetical protein
VIGQYFNFLSLSVAMIYFSLFLFYHFLGTFRSSFLIMQAVSTPAIPAIAPGSLEEYEIPDCDDSYIHSRCVNTSPKEKHATNYGYHCSAIPVMEEGVELN